MTDFPAVTASLEAAILRLYPIRSPFDRIRDALDAARARDEAQRSYRYLLHDGRALRDVGVSDADVRRALRDVR
jgi:hypothetical protein